MTNNLKKEEVELLFLACIDNAISLARAANVLYEKGSESIALGIAEIAQEELGKSFNCLALYSATDLEIDWKFFWKEWKNHHVKTHRAYFYEFFRTFRIEIKNKEAYFPTKRKSIPIEKEISFYVDFDHQNRKIIQPELEVDHDELGTRLTAIIGPLDTALKIKDLLTDKDYMYKSAFSDYARYTIDNEIYQQDVLDLLPKFKKGVENYDKAVDDIIELFKFD